MEKLINQSCNGLAGFCKASIAQSNETKTTDIQKANVSENSRSDNKQKPWSVFEDVYWI